MKQHIVPMGEVSAKPMPKVELSQKLREDRLKNKEARNKVRQAKLERFQRAEKTSMNIQRKLSAILNKRKSEQSMSRNEVARMYQQNYQEGQDTNILRTPNKFTQSDGRTNSVIQDSNILHAPNYLMQQKKQENKKKWL